MQCESLGEKLSAWIDGELPWAEGILLSWHVRSCPTCAAEAESLRALGARLAAANPVPTPPPAPIRRPATTPLVGAGALVACGLAAFWLVPRTEAPRLQAPSAQPTSAPARLALDRSEPVSTAPPATETFTNAARSSPTGLAAPARRSRTISRPRGVRRTVRRSAPERPRIRLARRTRAERPAPPRRVRRAPRPDSPVRVALATPEERLATPMTAVAPPPAPVVAAPLTRRAESVAEEETPRKRVVPVLVVTPTRYENVVYVTPGAMEVEGESGESEETR